MTQQVGGRNAQNIFTLFGWGSDGEYWRRVFADGGMVFRDCAELRSVFEARGCAIIVYGEYDVKYYSGTSSRWYSGLRGVPCRKSRILLATRHQSPG